MKKLLYLLLFIPLVSFGQYSTYYGSYDINVNANIKKNVNVTGNVNKTIRTIDYGALSQANAMKERNKIEKMKVQNAVDKEAMIAIAEDPINAYMFGKRNSWHGVSNFRNRAKVRGVKKYYWSWTDPHNSLFSMTYRNDPLIYGSDRWGRLDVYPVFENVSEDFITTEISLLGFYNINGIKDRDKRNLIGNKYKGIWADIERFVKKEWLIVGSYDKKNGFIHKKDINRARVYGYNGFSSSVISEDDYDYIIRDEYYAVNQGVIYVATVIYRGDKDEITFEDLEGRRFYLRRLVEKIISNSSVYQLEK